MYRNEESKKSKIATMLMSVSAVITFLGFTSFLVSGFYTPDPVALGFYGYGLLTVIIGIGSMALSAGLIEH